ncbi:uncharacterized protein [Bombus fervidus]|uniref:uncharacterized protein n=1 Tax=Bombus fervidus TaxID=203811 RepID=UPI003AB770AE
MALSRISNSYLSTSLSQVSHTANTSVGKMQCIRYAAVHQNRMKNLHFTSVRQYPDPPTLSLPTNVSEIFANETGRFTPERARDIAAPVLLYGKSDCRSFFSQQLSKPTERSNGLENSSDTHVDSYDCFGAVSLNGSMQSNVPKPFCSNGKSTHLNMPGGQWARDGKYIAEDMQKSHYRSTRLPQLKLNKSSLTSRVTENSLFKPKYIYNMGYSTKASQPPNNLLNDGKQQVVTPITHLSKKEKFKIIVKQYGTTVVIFHVALSLVSLGACYVAVIRGIDLKPIIHFIFNIEDDQINGVIGNTSTFLVAYGFHKLMAPIRFPITASVAPFLVKYLRRIGLLKPPKNIEKNKQQ